MFLAFKYPLFFPSVFYAEKDVSFESANAKEQVAKSTPAKRSRSANVHNLSEMVHTIPRGNWFQGLESFRNQSGPELG